MDSENEVLSNQSRQRRSELLSGRVMKFKARLGGHRTVRSSSELRATVSSKKPSVVSFDFFDTIVYRAVHEPADVFRLQHRDLLSQHLVKLGCAEWVALRKRVEAELCAAAEYGETCLSDIYQEIARELNAHPDFPAQASNLELMHEKAVIKPYQDVADLIHSFSRAGHHIVITTDTYLPHEFILSQLKSMLSCPFELNCSAETRRTKRRGLAFHEMRRKYGKNVIHFGDSVHSDVVSAHEHGVCGVLTSWRRPAWIKQNRGWIAYLKAIGCSRLVTPYDAGAVPAPAEELAWRWSVVLADFLLSIASHAKKNAVTDIWFLSRDTETLFKAARACEALSGIHSQYVYSSRSSTYPILALHDPKLFAAWVGRHPTSVDESHGLAATSYYQSLVRSTTKHILLIDVGWKGTLQAAIKHVVPENVVLTGYYFSLLPGALQSTVLASDRFIDWNHGVLNQAIVEALCGVEEPSCDHFARNNSGRVTPVFRSTKEGCATASYCDSLLRYLALLMSSISAGDRGSAELLYQRRKAVTSICFFPDKIVADALTGLSIGAANDASDTAELVGKGSVGLFSRLFGLGVKANLWPSGKVWSLSKNPMIARALQYNIWLRLLARFHARRLFACTGYFFRPRDSL
jgi:FMN phosphatase YigB (HAD superfamily)